MEKRIILVLLTLIFISCNTNKTNTTDLPQKVSIKKVNGNHNFYINDSIFKIKGVGFNYEYRADFENLKKTGANAIRTWTTKYADTILSAAKKFDFKVALGIHIGKELWGFDYNDSIAIKKQYERVTKIIEKYKNHPNLLCWVVGNELNLLFDENGGLKDVNPKVYEAMNDIVDYIHKNDPNHPVTITFAGVIPPHLKVAMEKIPELDLVSVQVYAGLETVENEMKATGITKPYMITEFGPKGFWEMPKTEWNREIEEASGPKVDGISNRIKKGLIKNNSGNCLGGFAFVWGQKHERTPTWYGMHHEDGKQTAYIDMITKLWTGKYPENRAPRVDSLLLDGKIATANIKLKPNQTYTANVYASDPNADKLIYKWEIAEEVDIRSQGGEKEQKPNRIPVKVIEEKNGQFTFTAPEKQGEYRILVYVYDNKNKAGNANIPFLIKE
ncbi:glycoside hydrolase family 2 TIM barrel-domain containing protein [Tenacibaculum sp. 190524A05c]|uniref:glycoside hydrolase family 2 TIM barrel-domain containing protein n=1 Tax=Tenacibaculum platacis TaxID=3137852 RepID=UPI0031FAB1D2